MALPGWQALDFLVAPLAGLVTLLGHVLGFRLVDGNLVEGVT
jgi:hypothetical protein